MDTTTNAGRERTAIDRSRARLAEVRSRLAAIDAERAALEREEGALRAAAAGFEAVAVDPSPAIRGGASMRREIALLLVEGARSIRDLPGLLGERFGRRVGKDDVWPVLSRMKAEGMLRSEGRGRWAIRRSRDPGTDLFATAKS